jgi:hypothetical protein
MAYLGELMESRWVKKQFKEKDFTVSYMLRGEKLEVTLMWCVTSFRLAI